MPSWSGRNMGVWTNRPHMARPYAGEGGPGVNASPMYRSLRLAPAIVRAMAIQFPTLTPMPDGFYWAPRCHLDTLPTGLYLHGELVASMVDRVDGTWLAILHAEEEISSPLVTRQCTSFEAGRRGCELWAARHHVHLQAKVANKLKWLQEHGIAARMLRKANPVPPEVTPN